MNLLKKLLSVTLLITAFKQAFAYLDPGSGSLITQALIALLAAGVTTFIMFRDKILYFLGIRKFKAKDEDDDTSPDSDIQDK